MAWDKVYLLKSGKRMSRDLLLPIIASLAYLATYKPDLLIELLKFCRDSEYTPRDLESVKVLRALELILPDGNIRGSVKEVVRSSIQGNDSNLRLVSPIAGSDDFP